MAIVPDPILFVDHAPALGGAERSLLLLLQHLDRTRWQPHLATPGGPLAAAAQALDVPVHLVPLPRLRRSPLFPLAWARGILALAAVARRAGAALLHANTVRAALYAAPAGRLSRRPFVWHMRDFWLAESRPQRAGPDRLGKRLLTATAARVIANSRAVAAHLPSSPRLVVVYNGIKTDHFDPELPGAPFRQKHQIPPQAPLVGMVGRLRPWKGQRHFIHAAALIRDKLPDAHFVIAGGDPFGVDEDYPALLLQLVEELNLAGSVTFTGHLEDVRPVLAALDLFIHPGDPEPFGLVNVEAMAMALPVLAFAHGALPELVTLETGVLVPPGDEVALAQAATRLLQDPAARQQMGRAGKVRATTYFDIKRTTGEIEALYARLCSPSKNR